MESTFAETTGGPDGENDLRRTDWEVNHAKISEVVESSLTELKRMPTYAEMAEKTGLGIATVKRHIKDLKNNRERFEKFRTLTESVVIGMAKAGRAGDARAGKLFFQFVEEWEEKKRITQVNQNPYANLSEEDLRKKAEERRAKAALRQKALDAARDV